MQTAQAKAERTFPSDVAQSAAETPGFDSFTDRLRFLKACRCESVDRPPVWLMRQAGRALPEYRKLKEKYSFLELVQTPALAAEVTLQPIRRFGFDAAILFSDILVVPEGLGQGYQFRETGGIQMDFILRTSEDIATLSCERLVERVQYVPQALRLIKTALNQKTALLGFAGSPWTLANFMLEGGSTGQFLRALNLFRNQRQLFDALCEKLTEAVTIYLQMQIDAGADAVQVFDSLGGLLPSPDFDAASGKWIQQIIAGLKGQVPVIVFAKGVNASWDSLLRTGAQVLSVDRDVSLSEMRRLLPSNIGIQGNLDPALLVNASPKKVAAETNTLLTEMRGRNGYIVNLGHGVPPDSKLENIAALVETVRNFV